MSDWIYAKDNWYHVTKITTEYIVKYFINGIQEYIDDTRVYIRQDWDD